MTTATEDIRCDRDGCDEPGTISPTRFYGCLCEKHAQGVELIARGLLPAIEAAIARMNAAKEAAA